MVIKKWKLHTKVKKILLGLSLVLVVVGGIQIWRTVTKEEIETEEETVYDYSTQSNVQYEVLLKPNNIYPKGVLGEDKTYTRELCDKVQVTFEEVLQMSEVTNIVGTYEIVAEVRGYTTKGEEKEIIWSKPFDKVPLTKVNISDTTAIIQESIQMTQADLLDYEAFIDEAIEVTKIKATPEVRLYIQGGLEGETAYGKIQHLILSEVFIPLKAETFEITKSYKEPLNDQFTQTITHVLPMNQGAVVGYSMLIVVGIVLGVGVLIFTRPPNKQEIHAYNVNKILHNYGSRMAATEEIDENNFVYNYYMQKIEDLIKVADELQKPIIYRRMNRKGIINRFYVMDSQTIYIYNMEQSSLNPPYEEEIEE